MNIFFLCFNTKQCAQWHCDKHVVKMILEYCQILYTVHHILGSELPANAYKKVHMKHPSVLWTASNKLHYEWLVDLALELNDEYEFRYEPKKPHASYSHLLWLQKNPPPAIPELLWDDPPPAMPDQYKVHGDTIQSYKNFYHGEKSDKGIIAYTGRSLPIWWRK
jgi:hypothetical protein